MRLNEAEDASQALSPRSASSAAQEPAQDPAADIPVRGKMLPGIAGIAMFMLFLTLLNVYGALTNVFGSGRSKYGVLALCTLLVVGVFGLLRMRRWGWAMVLAGTLLLFIGDASFFHMTHQPFFIIRGLFVLFFFLYLVRPEVRDRML